MSTDTARRYEAIKAFLAPGFTEPEDGWWPMENVEVGDRIGKLVYYSRTTCDVVFNGCYIPPVLKRVPPTELRKVDDKYNRRLRGDAEPEPTPKLKMAPAKLAQATEISTFTAEGYDTSGEWSVVQMGADGTETHVRNFTVHPDGRVARRFTLPPGSYQLRRR